MVCLHGVCNVFLVTNQPSHAELLSNCLCNARIMADITFSVVDGGVKGDLPLSLHHVA